MKNGYRSKGAVSDGLRDYLLDWEFLFSDKIKAKIFDLIVSMENEGEDYPPYAENLAIQVLLNSIAHKLVKPVKGRRTIYVCLCNKNYKQRVVALHEDYIEIANYLNRHAYDFLRDIGEENRKSLMDIVTHFSGGRSFQLHGDEAELGRIAIEVLTNESLIKILNNHKYLLNYATS